MTRNVEPRPTSLSTVSSPPSDATIPWQMESPSPVPSPTGLVVKNGSNRRPMISGGIPDPVSWTSTTARPASSVRLTTRTSLRAAAPSAIACAALTRRFTKTWPSRVSLASTAGTGERSVRRQARCWIALDARLTDDSMTRQTSTGATTSSSGRENVFRSRTIRRTRSAPSRACSTMRSSCSSGPTSLLSRARRSASASSLKITVVCQFLTSCLSLPDTLPVTPPTR